VNDAQLLRYSRHILLNELGDEGQDKLLASHALILGAGGLGSAGPRSGVRRTCEAFCITS
jgi:molybdopterin/thiamine biosynthesis adenylyltransferase